MMELSYSFITSTTLFSSGEVLVTAQFTGNVLVGSPRGSSSGDARALAAMNVSAYRMRILPGEEEVVI